MTKYDNSQDPALFADEWLGLCWEDVDSTIAAVQLMQMDKFFKLAVVHELEKRRV